MALLRALEPGRRATRRPGRDPRGRGLARRYGTPHGGSRPRARHRRPVYLCDTWKGVVKTGAIDTYYRDGKHDDASPRMVEKLVAELGLRNVELLQGVFPDETGEQIADRTFRLCHCDVDVYQSAKDVLDWVWPRLSPGGVVVFDDYGFPACPGVTKLVDEQRMRRRPARPPQPQRPWPRRQALSRRARTSYGQSRTSHPVDRFGVWLSGVAVRRHARLRRTRARRLRLRLRGELRATQLDVASIGRARRRRARRRPEARSQGHRDRGRACGRAADDPEPRRSTSTLCLSVLEHLWEPGEALRELRRVTAPGGVVLVNVPTWRGKRALEFAAFRLGVSPAEEMDDHKRYYDPRDLWPLLVRGGLPTERHPLLPPQVRPQHVRGLPRRAERRLTTSPRRTSRRRHEIVAELDRDAIERVAHGLAAVRDGGGRLFVLGVGGSAGARQPRRQRLPQALRPRGVRADRQRRRADRADQRRGLGDAFAAWLRGLAPPRRRRRARLLGRRRRRRARRLASTSCARSSSPRSGREGVRRRRPRRRLHRAVADECVVIPPLERERVTPHTEGLCAVVWHLLVSHPALQAPPRSGSRSAERCASAANGRVARRRRRRLHRRPRRRPAARRDGRRAGHGLRQLLLGPRWHLDASRGRPAARGRAGRRQGPRGAHGGAWRARRGRPPRLEPRHRPGGDRAERSTSTRARCSPTTWSRRCASHRRRPRSSTRPGAACTATSARPRRTRTGAARPDLDVRREQARRRGADRRLLLHVRTRRGERSGSATSSGRGRPTASGSTSSARCSPTRRVCGSSATARRASRTSTSRTSSPRCCSARRDGASRTRAFNVATGDYITVTEIAELAVEMRRARSERGRASSTRAATGAGRVTSRSCGSRSSASAALGWTPTRSSREALRESMRDARGPMRAGRL